MSLKDVRAAARGDDGATPRGGGRPDERRDADGGSAGSGAYTETADKFIEDESGTATTRTACMDCGGVPMPGALRCVPCFHRWLDATKGRWWGTSRADQRGAGHEAVRTVRVPTWRRGDAA